MNNGVRFDGPFLNAGPLRESKNLATAESQVSSHVLETKGGISFLHMFHLDTAVFPAFLNWTCESHHILQQDMGVSSFATRPSDSPKGAVSLPDKYLLHLRSACSIE